MACRAEQKNGGVVAPADYWHIHEVGGYAIWADAEVGRPPRTWLSAMPPWQHFKQVNGKRYKFDGIGSKSIKNSIIRYNKWKLSGYGWKAHFRQLGHITPVF